MKQIMQTAFSDEDKKIRGNCFWAAISSVTEIPLELFKDFQYMSDGTWFPPLWDILTKNGFTYHGMIRDKEKILNYTIGVDGYYVVTGGSPRGFKSSHAVVFKDGKMVHDPHPEGTGITSIDHAYMIERIEK
jgi:hypothetical protein